MKIEEMLDIFDVDEIEKMSPEECKGLLKGFFIGAGITRAIGEWFDELIDKRYKKKKRIRIKLIRLCVRIVRILGIFSLNSSLVKMLRMFLTTFERGLNAAIRSM